MGGTSKGISTLVTYPLQVVQNRLRVSDTVTNIKGIRIPKDTHVLDSWWSTLGFKYRVDLLAVCYGFLLAASMSHRSFSEVLFRILVQQSISCMKT